MPSGPLGTICVYSLLVVVGIVGAIGDATLNQWAKTNRIMWLLVSYVVWIGVATLFGFVLKWERFAFSGAVVLALLVHCAVVILYDCQFSERRLNGWEWAGFACAVLAICLMEIGRNTAAQAEKPAQKPAVEEVAVHNP